MHDFRYNQFSPPHHARADRRAYHDAAAVYQCPRCLAVCIMLSTLGHAKQRDTIESSWNWLLGCSTKLIRGPGSWLRGATVHVIPPHSRPPSLQANPSEPPRPGQDSGEMACSAPAPPRSSKERPRSVYAYALLPPSAASRRQSNAAVCAVGVAAPGGRDGADAMRQEGSAVIAHNDVLASNAPGQTL